MKFLKFLLPTLFVGAFTLATAPKIQAITVDEVFDKIRNELATIKGNKVVADYSSGLHGIPGEFENHEGRDIVVQIGKDCKNFFKQFFWGTSPSEGLHGVLSEWRIADKEGVCPKGEILVRDAFPEWGDYLEPGRDYCVKNTIFKSLEEMKKDVKKEIEEMKDKDDDRGDKDKDHKDY